MKKNVLVTGGAGFIGSNLSLRLLALGYKVTVLDNLSEQIHGNYSELYSSIEGKVNFIKGDVRLKEDWHRALKNQSIVVHLAAETGTGQSMYEVQKYVDVNVNGTAILLDFLVNCKHEVQKVIVASSRAIYGEGKYECEAHGILYPKGRNERDLLNGNYEPKCHICSSDIKVLPTDEGSEIHPSSLYGITKHNQEQMVLNVCNSINIPAVAFRYQNVYGPGQSLKNPYTGIISIFSTQILNGNNINIFEDGEESRDFVYIEDVVTATTLGIENAAANGQIFNVGSGKQTKVSEVAAKLKEYYNSNIDINISGNFRLGDIRHNYADLSKIRKMLNFEPKYSFNEGLKLFVKWANNQVINDDRYLESVRELKSKGFLK